MGEWDNITNYYELIKSVKEAYEKIQDDLIYSGYTIIIDPFNKKSYLKNKIRKLKRLINK